MDYGILTCEFRIRSERMKIFTGTVSENPCKGIKCETYCSNCQLGGQKLKYDIQLPILSKIKDVDIDQALCDWANISGTCNGIIDGIIAGTVIVNYDRRFSDYLKQKLSVQELNQEWI